MELDVYARKTLQLARRMQNHQSKSRNQFHYYCIYYDNNNLLNPKSGGIGLTLTTMPYIKLILDFTIHYQSSKRSFWDFLCGRLSKVTIKVQEIQIPESLLGKNYEEDQVFRNDLKQWLEKIWQDKDTILTGLNKTSAR